MNRAETQYWIDKLPPVRTALEGRDIVVIGHQRWDSHFTVVHGLTLRLAKRNRVVFVEPPDSAASLLHHPAARKSLRRAFSRLERYGDNFGVYHVPSLFLPFQPYSRSILRSIEWTYLRMVRDAMRRMELRNPLLWIYQFNSVALIDALEPPASVYECVEEAAGFTRNRRKQQYVRDMDARLCRRADIVFVPNEQMRATRSDLARAIDVLPWPVDYDHYSQAMNPEVEVPADLRAVKPPVIGFFGNVDACRFDVELICQLAQRRPEWSFVIVGRFWQGFDPAPLLRLPNLHHLGEKRPSELPAYLKGFDVCIIPYLLNDFTRSITPLKLMEYLATGRPVVTAPLPAALPFGDVLGIASNVDEFEAEITAALDAPEEKRAARLRVAREHDWESCMRRKAERVVALLRPARSPRAAAAVSATGS